MCNFQLKPIGGSSLYTIHAIVSYIENKGLKGDLFFEETISGYLVCAGDEVLSFCRHQHEAYNVVADKLSEFEQRMAPRKAGDGE